MDDLLLQCVQIKDLELGFYFNLKSKIFFFFWCVLWFVCGGWGEGGGGCGGAWANTNSVEFWT